MSGISIISALGRQRKLATSRPILDSLCWELSEEEKRGREETGEKRGKGRGGGRKGEESLCEECTLFPVC